MLRGKKKQRVASIMHTSGGIKITHAERTFTAAVGHGVANIYDLPLSSGLESAHWREEGTLFLVMASLSKPVRTSEESFDVGVARRFEDPRDVHCSPLSIRRRLPGIQHGVTGPVMVQQRRSTLKSFDTCSHACSKQVAVHYTTTSLALHCYVMGHRVGGEESAVGGSSGRENGSQL